jgi:hypothetical protein
MRFARLLVAALVLIGSGLGAHAIAQTQIKITPATVTPTTVYSCVNKTTLIPRIVSGASSCNTKTEALKEWSIMGPTGATGAKGATGAIGSIGATGATGKTGAQGPAGVEGPTGPTGPQGPAGSNGPVGPSYYSASITFPELPADGTTSAIVNAPITGAYQGVITPLGGFNIGTFIYVPYSCTAKNFKATFTSIPAAGGIGTASVLLNTSYYANPGLYPGRFNPIVPATSCTVQVSTATDSDEGISCSTATPTQGFGGTGAYNMAWLEFDLTNPYLFSHANAFVTFSCD